MSARQLDLATTRATGSGMLTVAAAGGLLAFRFGRGLDRLAPIITLVGAAGLSPFAVTGAGTALSLGLGPTQGVIVILGGVTAVGGGTMRDVLIQRVPGLLRSELYAVPALVAATVTVLSAEAHECPTRSLSSRWGIGVVRTP